MIYCLCNNFYIPMKKRRQKTYVQHEYNVIQNKYEQKHNKIANTTVLGFYIEKIGTMISKFKFFGLLYIILNNIILYCLNY